MATLDVRYCHEHKTWLLGTASIERHFANDIDILLESEDLSDKICKICLHDETVRPSVRAKQFQAPYKVAEHVYDCHIRPLHSEIIQCDICKINFIQLDWPQHLIDEHQIAICGCNEEGKPCDFLEDPFLLRVPRDHEEEKLCYLRCIGIIGEEGWVVEEGQGEEEQDVFTGWWHNKGVISDEAQAAGLHPGATPAEPLQYLAAMYAERQHKMSWDLERAKREAKGPRKRNKPAGYYRERWDNMPLVKKQAQLEKQKQKQAAQTSEEVKRDQEKAQAQYKGPTEDSCAQNKEAQARCWANKSEEKKEQEKAKKNKKRRTPEAQAAHNLALKEKRADHTLEQRVNVRTAGSEYH